MSPALKALIVAVVTVTGSCLALEAGLGLAHSKPRVMMRDVIDLRPGSFSYRVSGDFTRDGRPAVSPIVTARIERALSIMRSEVTAADYRRCIDAKACPDIEQDADTVDLPMVRTNWQDATAYATWLSRETGEYWRLPTDEEWAFAAGSHFDDDLLAASFDGKNPSRRALALYDRDAAQADEIGRALRPVGGFGENENGLLDVGGNVWEWTNTCFERSQLGEQDDVRVSTVNCGVRVVEGRHRTYMTDFIRDPRAGGCVIGLPPTHLGFRLVRDAGQWPRLNLLWALAEQLFGIRTRSG